MPRIFTSGMAFPTLELFQHETNRSNQISEMQENFLNTKTLQFGAIKNINMTLKLFVIAFARKRKEFS